MVCRQLAKIGAGIAIIYNLLTSQGYAQNIEGTIEKIPSRERTKGVVELININTKKDYSCKSDSITGRFALDVPDGEYERRVYVEGTHFLNDTIRINSENYQINEDWYDEYWGRWDKRYGKTQDWNLQLIEYTKAKSTHQSIEGKSTLDVLKLLTRSRGAPDDKEPHIENYDGEITIYLRRPDPQDSISMPKEYEEYIDSALANIKERTQGIVNLIEVEDSNSAKIKQSYPKTRDIPYGGAGANGYTCTYDKAGEYLDSAKIYIARDVIDPPHSKVTQTRELGRALGFIDTALDPTYAMYNTGIVGTAVFFHDDEIEALKIKSALKSGTYILSHKDSIITTLPNITGVEDIVEKEKSYALSQNYPNPFNNTTNIKYTIQKESGVEIKIFNILGQEIKTILEEKELSAGTYNTTINLENMPSGIYFYRIDIQDKDKTYSQTKKMILEK